MNDLTIIYLTLNKLPKRWVDFQLKHLLKSANGSQIISVSKQPMDLGINIIDIEKPSYWNIYMQMLRACLIAKTDYIAVAEDDVLYTKEHFTEFRPKLNEVSYDRSRWSLFAWDNMYCMRQRISNCSLIAPREYYIEALTERKNKHPNGVKQHLAGEVGRLKVDKNLGVSVRNCVEWYCTNPIVQLNHPTGTDTGLNRINGRKMIKKHGQIKAYDIPFWGKADELLNEYSG